MNRPPAPLRLRFTLRPPLHLAGFTLIEVLVALLIASVGVLGVATLQTVSMMNLQTARLRSIVALQASSFATAMHANSSFWTFNRAPSTFSVVGRVITDSTGALNAAGINCVNNSPPATGQCTAAALAAYDVQNWADTMTQLIPGYTANVACTTDITQPYRCTLNILWTERYGRSRGAVVANSAATGGQRSFSLYIQP